MRDVEDKRPIAQGNIPADFIDNPFVAADQIRTKGFVILKWPEPISPVVSPVVIGQAGQVFMPD